MSSQVEISGYDSQWAEEYTRERAKIVETLRGVCVGIEHIGSTSVLNLGAKPIIDIMVGVEDLASIQSEHRERLLGIQYEYVHKPDFPKRAFFRRGEWGAGTHHLHIYKYKGEHWENHLLFRDYLKAHPEGLRAYDNLKKDLAYQFKYERAAYTEAKGPFIRQMVEQAKLERNRQGQMNS
ncbi:GrpB family protein [Paenibacillus sp. 28ISP30-2]|uniref:GrpB family protein n=1 Tax=Paenibacillus sp. 23TSA30-6 TaxID=2546104 RepID=UPI001787CAF6|nr:GrpB family protein [Paenibacillus sp. 23TSA30-6]MBE0336494.1 GrpB family protein [Paenibacillus sp. 23TSA30-6]MBE0342516.1 GrpB family protein [Paenibacillus sp. 28ISP30-2]